MRWVALERLHELLCGLRVSLLKHHPEGHLRVAFRTERVDFENTLGISDGVGNLALPQSRDRAFAQQLLIIGLDLERLCQMLLERGPIGSPANLPDLLTHQQCLAALLQRLSSVRSKRA